MPATIAAIVVTAMIEMLRRFLRGSFSGSIMLIRAGLSKNTLPDICFVVIIA